jgi:hypothetical protein
MTIVCAWSRFPTSTPTSSPLIALTGSNQLENIAIWTTLALNVYASIERKLACHLLVLRAQRGQDSGHYRQRYHHRTDHEQVQLKMGNSSLEIQ